MFTLLWNLSAGLRGYVRVYLPSNRTVDRLRSARGRKLSTLVCLIATPSYLFATSICATIVARGGPAYLNLLVLLFAWNAIKFAAMGVLIPAQWLTLRLRRSALGQQVDMSAGLGSNRPIVVARPFGGVRGRRR